MNEIELAKLEREKAFVPPGVAALILGVSDARVRQRILAGTLAVKKLCGSRFVYVYSIVAAIKSRRLKKRPQQPKRRAWPT